MKKHPKAAFRFGSAVAAMLALSLLACLTSCFTTPPAGPPAKDTHEAVTLPPVILPDLTDDRIVTDTAPYAETLETLFTANEPAPAADFTYDVMENGVRITGYTGGEVVLVIPDTVEDKSVVAIAEGAFKDMGNLKAVSVPDSVRVIGASAFEGCMSLTTLRTPVVTCPERPFFGALFGAENHEANGSFVPPALSTLVMTAGTSEGQNADGRLPAYAFYACRGLETVSLPATLTEIGDFAFYGCQSLAYIPLAHTVLTRVGARAFANGGALLGLSLPATVTYMGAGMLEGCGKLETLVIPFVGGCTYDYPLTEEEKEAIEVGDALHPAQSSAYLGYLFGASSHTFTAGYLPASLITVEVLEGCESIPANAFFECASVREFILPATVKTIGRRAFYGCEALSKMTVPAGVTAIGDDAFHGCIRLVEVDFPTADGTVELGVQTFMDCRSLVTVTLPEEVEHLPNSCFSGCLSLKTLTAEGVKTRGKQVFRHCDQLTGWEK